MEMVRHYREFIQGDVRANDWGVEPSCRHNLPRPQKRYASISLIAKDTPTLPGADRYEICPALGVIKALDPD
jgi:hypothetical protein